MSGVFQNASASPQVYPPSPARLTSRTRRSSASLTPQDSRIPGVATRARNQLRSSKPGGEQARRASADDRDTSSFRSRHFRIFSPLDFPTGGEIDGDQP